MKLIYVVNSLEVGGVTEVVKATLQKLEINYNVLIVSLNNNTSGWDNNLNIPTKIFNINPIFKYSLIDYFNDIIIGKTIKTNYQPVIDFLIDQKPDIIHFHTLPRFLRIGTFVKEQINCKLVFTDHAVRIRKNEYNSIIRFSLSLIYKKVYKHYNVIFVSKAVEEVAKRYKFINNDKKHIRIDNGLEISLYKPNNRNNKIIVFIYVARITPVKGHLELINAWSNINSNIERELWLVGPNEMEDTIQKKIETLSCSNVKLLGSRKDIIELLQIADIALFPSQLEGLPIALLEKMAMQLPVIVSNIPELTNIIDDGQDGLIYELNNTLELTTKMKTLLENNNLRIELGKQARIKVEKYYSINTVVENLETFYKSL